MDARFESINNLLIRYSLGDFNYSIQPSENYDEIDAFITNINMLGEELKASTISRNYFNNIFHSVSDMLLALDNEGNITSINKAVSEKMLYSENQLKESSINFLTGEGNDFFSYIKGLLSKNKFVSNVEVNFYTLDGASIPMNCSCNYLYDQYQKKIGYLMIARDQTKMKEYEYSLLESEKKFRKIFEESTDCAFITDSNSVFMELNKAGMELLKCGDEALNRDSLFRYFNDLIDKNTFLELLKDRGFLADFKLKIRDNSGNIIDCLLSVNKVINGFGETKGYQGMIKNMSRQKEIENLVIRTIIDTQETERKRIVKDLHDRLGQQLFAIKSYLGTLNSLRAKMAPDKYEDMLGKAGDALKEAIDELSNICFNIMPGTLQKFGLGHAINELCVKIKGSSNVDFKINIAPDFPHIDKNLEVTIFRIIQEFISNSIKHGRPNIIVVKLISDPASEKLFLVLKDNGQGFDIKKMEEFKGSGLRNAKSRVESYSGVFKINSVQGVGTKYEIMIPYKQYLLK